MRRAVSDSFKSSDSGSKADGQLDGQPDRQTDIQTDGRTDGQQTKWQTVWTGEQNAPACVMKRLGAANWRVRMRKRSTMWACQMSGNGSGLVFFLYYIIIFKV